MTLRDIVRSILRRDEGGDDATIGFDTQFDRDGVNLVAARSDLSVIEAGGGGVRATTQLVLLRMLEEQGLAESIPGGFHIPAPHAVRVDDDMADILRLPGHYAGGFHARVNAFTASTAFGVKIVAERGDGAVPVVWSGAVLRIGSATFRCTPGQLRAFAAVEAHTALSSEERTESANVRLVAELQQAVEEGMKLSLANFDRGGWRSAEVNRVGVTGEVTTAGDLILSPSLDVDVDPLLWERRWGQLRGAGASGGVLRVDNNIIILDGDAVGAVAEVLGNRVIPRESVAEFLRTPSAFLDASLVDLDLGFSVRVEGIGRLTHIDFGEAAPSKLDWFADSQPLAPTVLREMLRTPEDLERFEREYEASSAQHATSMEFGGEVIDIREPEAVAETLSAVRERISLPAPPIEEAPVREAGEETEKVDKVGFLLREADEIVERLRERAREAARGVVVDTSPLARDPFPHQLDGIKWIAGLMAAARAEASDELYRLQGALLADDMGLGKTYMTLVAIQQHLARIEREDGRHAVKPVLIVAPLSLIENWEDELAKTFRTMPFADVVVLQSGRDLAEYRVRGAGREGYQPESALDAEGRVIDGRLRISLHVGPEAGIHRLDRPRRLVLTTYDTLRDYQFSLSQIDWGVVVFDEAQAIKNPDTIRTRAAKALKADFKLLATGTPVENNLGEFWCLIDTAQPGLLGDWSSFRARYLIPLAEAGDDADAMRVRIGREIHQAVGPFMLRRVKEDHLEGLPSKVTHTGLLPAAIGETVIDERLAPVMPGAQAARYDAHLERFRSSKHSSQPTAAVAVLQSMRLCSLHPDLDVHGVRPDLPSTVEMTRIQLAQSAKLQAAMEVIRAVRARGEKVIVFAISKDLQLLMTLWIQHEFGVRPDIVNGETSAVSRSGSAKAGASRRQILRRFEAVAGFNVIVMSPIAAGVGLTVVGANHVIHLERHWNPAKEAQATDRVYRIGQTRDVHIYYPAARHPRYESFDVLLDRLLAGKVSVKDAVMAPGEVSDAELAGLMSQLT